MERSTPKSEAEKKKTQHIPMYFSSANDCRVVPACGGVLGYIFPRTFIFSSSGVETKLGIPPIDLGWYFVNRDKRISCPAY